MNEKKEEDYIFAYTIQHLFWCVKLNSIPYQNIAYN